MKKTNFTQDEQLIAEAILESRKVQEYLWKGISELRKLPYNIKLWEKAFQKRVDKIANIETDNPSYKIELRKRLLQQAALSILALRILDSEK